MTDPEPLLDVARGDAARSAMLRRSLTALRDHTTDTRFRALLDDVLAGRTGLRAAAFSEAFGQGIADSVQQGAERYNQLSEEERDQLAEQGQRDTEALRDPSPANRTAEPDDEDEPPVIRHDSW